jgi:histidinol dehydrogenase
MPLRLDINDAGFEDSFSRFVHARRDAGGDVAEVVAAIIDDVRQRGDAALTDYSRRFDRCELTAENIRVGRDEIEQAAAACDSAVIKALNAARARIADYHARQMPHDLDYTDDAGVRLGYRWRAIAAAGLYVPGGRAAYPSSVLMNAVPAKVAGVERLVMVTPAPGGELSPYVLAAAAIAGVDEIYRVGGAQAVAALAYGTESIRPVDKISGPGNAYVAEAKRQVFGAVGIDMIAGPSEILIVADSLNDPGWIALDLMAQAEHDPSARSILITDDKNFAEAVTAAVTAGLESLPRANIAAASWRQWGAVITVGSLAQAPALVDRIAPEHLQLAVEDPGALADEIRNAGAIFLGRFTPEAIGDYIAGPNHVLPTGGGARFSSGLGVFDFLKRTSLIGCGADGVKAIGGDAITLARAEGLEAHALSVAARLDPKTPSGD